MLSEAKSLSEIVNVRTRNTFNVNLILVILFHIDILGGTKVITLFGIITTSFLN